MDKFMSILKKVFIVLSWVILGGGTIFVLLAAIDKKEAWLCEKVEVDIVGVKNIYFVDQQDVLRILTANGSYKPVGKKISEINLRRLEELLEKNPWVKEADLFVDNQKVLRVRISEREPVARVFSDKGYSFYLDALGTVLPLSDNYSARVPVFTGYKGGTEKLIKEDSIVLSNIREVAEYIYDNNFWMAQVSQVYINENGGFEIVPTIGNHIIKFGYVAGFESKFERLEAFYKQLFRNVGMDTYSILDIRYKGQLVAIKRNAENEKKIIAVNKEATVPVAVNELPVKAQPPLKTEKNKLPKENTLNPNSVKNQNPVPKALMTSGQNVVNENRSKEHL